MTRFEIGHDYTRAAIHAAVGGSRRSCLPARDGVVRAACLLATLNPQAPHVMLCGTGPQNGAAGALLAQQVVPVPIFIKQAVNRWRYAGSFVVTASFDAGPRFERHLAASMRTRDSVSRIVLLAPA